MDDMTLPRQIHVSKLTGKLNGFQSISNNTTTNKYCYDRYEQAKIKNKKAGKVVDICGVCYSQSMLNGMRKNMKPALDRNEFIAERILNPNELPTILAAFHRFHAHGELLTELINPETGETVKKYDKFTHIENLCRIAEHNPHCNFALWTKRTDIIKPFFNQRKKPSNLILIYSNPKTNHILQKVPQHFDRTFNNVEADKFTDKQNCTGQKCIDCMLCYKPNNGVDTIVEKIKKY